LDTENHNKTIRTSAMGMENSPSLYYTLQKNLTSHRSVVQQLGDGEGGIAAESQRWMVLKASFQRPFLMASREFLILADTALKEPST
jgi:hypothetical protein